MIHLVVKDIETGIILLILAHLKDIFSKHIKVPFLGSQLIRFTIDNIIQIYIALLVVSNVVVSIKNSLN